MVNERASGTTVRPPGASCRHKKQASIRGFVRPDRQIGPQPGLRVVPRRPRSQSDRTNRSASAATPDTMQWQTRREPQAAIWYGSRTRLGGCIHGDDKDDEDDEDDEDRSGSDGVGGVMHRQDSHCSLFLLTRDDDRWTESLNQGPAKAPR